jgi:hypothetical protein
MKNFLSTAPLPGQEDDDGAEAGVEGADDALSLLELEEVEVDSAPDEDAPLSPDVDEAAPPPDAAGLAFDESPPRKSVTYQPEPLSWKPAAVTCLTYVGLPQAGQTVRGASDIFCSTSSAWPQVLHL